MEYVGLTGVKGPHLCYKTKINESHEMWKIFLPNIWDVYVGVEYKKKIMK